MKPLRSLLLLLSLAMVHTAHGQPGVAFEAANAAYEAGEYDDALMRYESLLETHRHFESEFNAGNAAFKLGAWGRARLHYERAKLLDPSNEHLQANLALLESKIVDRITAIPKLGLTSWLSSWVGPGMLTGWVCWTLLWWSLSWVLWMVRWRKTSQDSRNTIGFLAFASLILGLIGLGCVRESNARTESARQLVVMSERVDVTSSPSAAGTVLFQLHEGTCAFILDRTPGWTEVELDNGNVGWIPESATEDV